MSTDQNTTNPNVMRPIEESKAGSGAKWIIGLGIGCGGILALCCGLGVLGMYLIGSSLQESITEDPQMVVELTGQLTEIDIPEKLKPKLAVDAKIPFTDKMYFKGVVFDAEKEDALLVIGMLGEWLQSKYADVQSQREEELRTVLELIAQEDKVNQHEDMVVENLRQKKVAIRGKEAVFNITTGKGVATRAPRIEVDGSFIGKDGHPVVLALFADADALNEEQVDAIIESIK